MIFNGQGMSTMKIRILLILILLFILALLLENKSINESNINKIDIQNKLITSINNGAPIDVIKQIYSNRTYVELGLFKNYFTNKDNYYKYDTPLSTILYDIKTKYFLDKDSKIDINNTINIIKNYSIINPFDSLEISQKDMFVNIQLKLKKDNYLLIQNDLEKISKELTEKNTLVDQYLKDSTNSFWISISAVILSLFIGVIQIYISREERFRQIISEEIKANNK